jgi:hypothetical protein
VRTEAIAWVLRFAQDDRAVTTEAIAWVLRLAQDDRAVTTEAIAWVLRFAQDDSGWDRRLHTVHALRSRAHPILNEASTHLRVIQVCLLRFY